MGKNIYKETINNKRIKLIQSKKFKEHMESHMDDFIVPFNQLLYKIEETLSNKGIKDNFIETVISFPNNIGYSNINKIEDEDNIIYAKRIGRNLYSKFELNKEKKLTNKCVVVLSKNKYRDNEYYLITIFPGEKAIKEVGDINIKTEEERENVISFWRENAFVFNENLIQDGTVVKECPY